MEPGVHCCSVFLFPLQQKQAPSDNAVFVPSKADVHLSLEYPAPLQYITHTNLKDIRKMQENSVNLLKYYI
jgi:hypothetical protein